MNKITTHFIDIDKVIQVLHLKGLCVSFSTNELTNQLEIIMEE